MPVGSYSRPHKYFPPKDYFEYVFWNDLGYEIPSSQLPYTSKVGERVVKYAGSKSELIELAQRECRKLGGNWIILDRYEAMSEGANLLTATAYLIDYGRGKSFVGQLIQNGLTQEQLLAAWNYRDPDAFEGIYQAVTEENGYKLKIGMYKYEDGKYYLFYLDGITGTKSWKEGNVIGVFEPTVYELAFLGQWVNLDKYSTSSELVFLDFGAFTITHKPWRSDAEIETTYVKMYPKDATNDEPTFSGGSGTGFLLNGKGYVVTCYHVVDGAKQIFVEDNDRAKSLLPASLVAYDKQNDLCILKVKGLSANPNAALPYGFDITTNKTGETVFCMGYPLTQIMGDEIKVTNGIISSTTGFRGDVSCYQVSAPVQPGNSGGPLFNSEGNVIGIMNARIPQAENVSYALKTAYLNKLLGMLTDDIKIHKVDQRSLNVSTLVDKFKPFVYTIYASDQ